MSPLSRRMLLTTGLAAAGTLLRRRGRDAGTTPRPGAAGRRRALRRRARR